MATTSRQTSLFGIEDWKKLYKTYQGADFRSYNFETLRKTFIDYLQQHHPENFNDFTESSEFVAHLDLLAFMGQSLSFRNDLNMRENFLDTAERTDSVNRLAKLVSYSPKRSIASSGFLKVKSVSTTENLLDFNQKNIGGTTIRWDDKSNNDWQEQFTTILNAALVNSQKIGQSGNSNTIAGVKTDEYTLNMPDGYIPTIPFTESVDGTAMQFEVVNSTSKNATHIYEPTPIQNTKINMLYRNDTQGFASVNTGYFFYFKQGTLTTSDFELEDQITNRTVDIDVPGINNSDVWLLHADVNNGNTTEWDMVENIYSSDPDQTNSRTRNYFGVTNRVDDSISLNFGDGIFSELPLGAFRTYVRSSNGLDYTISTSELQGITVGLQYISKSGRTETITFTLSLTQTVSNAKSKETLDDIKRRAPAKFYSQNRMVNGEDYNNFPYTSFSNIIKSKAVLRTNIGTSRYLDLVDPTGKFSSINVFSDDGLLYNENTFDTFSFSFNDRSDIQSAINNKIEPLLGNRKTTHFYYDSYPRTTLDLDMKWNISTTYTNEMTGYFIDTNINEPAKIGQYATSSSTRVELVPGALVKFIPPVGYHFSGNNHLIMGTPTKPDSKMEIWSSLIQVEHDGTNLGEGNNEIGIGPVVINEHVPSGAIPSSVILPYVTEISTNVQLAMVLAMEDNRDFGLGFDSKSIGTEWYIISDENLDSADSFSLLNVKDDSNSNSDNSWIVKFKFNDGKYTVTSRSLRYFFASVLETRFYHDNNQRIYDQKTGKVVSDHINLLAVNNQPDTNIPLAGEVRLDIIDQSVESDGYINDFNVEVSYADSDIDGIVDDPDFFNKFIQPDVNISDKFVFFRSNIDFDNLQRYLPVTPGEINSEYRTFDDINVIKTGFVDGQIFFVYGENEFYKKDTINFEPTLTIETDLIARVGRGNVKFQYKHYSPETRRINPGTTNIIDLYVVPNNYHIAYTQYLQDITNTIEEPKEPSNAELVTDYESLDNYKMISDNMILNSVKFKPLFGNKSDLSLQATIKVVKVKNNFISESEIKSSVILAINEYFDINLWDFGDTFYFSELSAYLHNKLGDSIGSIVVLPKDPSKEFGNLYEIKSLANEIFVSSATVNDVEIIDSLTLGELQIGK